MSDRFTKKNVERAFQHLADVLDWQPEEVWLETWAPGDGAIRYRVVERYHGHEGTPASGYGGVTAGVFGSGYWYGAREAYTALHAAAAMAHVMKNGETTAIPHVRRAS